MGRVFCVVIFWEGRRRESIFHIWRLDVRKGTRTHNFGNCTQRVGQMHLLLRIRLGPYLHILAEPTLGVETHSEHSAVSSSRLKGEMQQGGIQKSRKFDGESKVKTNHLTQMEPIPLLHYTENRFRLSLHASTAFSTVQVTHNCRHLSLVHSRSVPLRLND